MGIERSPSNIGDKLTWRRARAASDPLSYRPLQITVDLGMGVLDLSREIIIVPDLNFCLNLTCVTVFFLFFYPVLDICYHVTMTLLHPAQHTYSYKIHT